MLGHDLAQGRVCSRPALLLVLVLVTAVVFLTKLADGLFEPPSSPSAPSLANRLETSELLWQASVEQRLALYDKFGGPDAVAWPSSSPLPCAYVPTERGDAPQKQRADRAREQTTPSGTSFRRHLTARTRCGGLAPSWTAVGESPFGGTPIITRLA